MKQVLIHLTRCGLNTQKTLLLCAILLSCNSALLAKVNVQEDDQDTTGQTTFNRCR